MYSIYFVILFFPTFLGFATAASLLENGDDFSNNLVSDLAPLLALFGERVTTQFMSQSTGWADCIALAMAPVGVVTIIVSAIRVTGPRWLKAVVGRARENVAAAELEVMSSTSSEACELWNGKTRGVVRCPGTTDNCEFMCIYRTSMLGNNQETNLLKVQVMDIEDAKNCCETRDSNQQEMQTGSPPLDQQRNSLASPKSDDTIIITRNTTHPAPNMTLNCSADGERWQMRACAAVGVIIQSGVLIFFGFLTEYKTLAFEKDDSPVEKYAMPMAVVGTLVLNLGILVCAHAVDESSKEEVYEVTDNSAAVAMVWLQKKTKVSEQDFDSAAIYPTMKRSRAYTSERTIDNDGKQTAETEDNSWWLKLMSTTGTAISLVGFFVQFIGLRGMHWLATITQLGAIIVMTILRAVVRRHLASGLASHDLCDSAGFELEWFVSSFLQKDGIPWIPHQHSDRQPTGNSGTETESSKFTFELQTSTTKFVVRPPTPTQEPTGSANQSSSLVSVLQHPQKSCDLQHAQGLLDLRRDLGELSKWKGPTSREALAVANAIEKTMAFMMPYLKDDEKDFIWEINVKRHRTHPENTNDNIPDYIRMNIKYSQNNGWTAPVDEIEAALSLWLYSMKEVHRPDSTNSKFPSGNDHWIRGSPAQQQRCLQILGRSEDLLLRDLEWWMPKGLDGILAANVKGLNDNSSDNGNGNGNDNDNENFPYTVKRERVGYSGQRLSKQDDNGNPLTEHLSHWDWKSATAVHRHVTDDEQESYYYEAQGDYENVWSVEQPATQPFNWLVVESQDPLERFYAKEVFTAFVWAVTSYLEESRISHQLQAKVQPSSATGPDAWKIFSLENQELSRFVQSLAALNLWTEQEAWCSIIPPLSATDNLPGLNAVIEMAQRNAAVLERDLAWRQAGSAYRWLFDIGMSSSPTSHIYVKSTAILWRFEQRLSSSESPYCDSDYHLRGDGLMYELIRVKKRLIRQKERNPTIKGNLSVFFYIYQELDRLIERVGLWRDLHSIQLDKLCLGGAAGRRAYGSFQTPQDVFDRTELHHAMRSNFVDHEELASPMKNHRWALMGFWRDWPDNHQHYVECLKLVTTKLNDLDLYPIRLSREILLAVLLPFQTFDCLLESGVDPNTRDLDGWTPLHYACQCPVPGSETYSQNESFFKVRDELRVAILITNKADVDAQGLDGNTPLHCAAMSGREELIRLLIDSGCDVKVANLEGRTPLHLLAMTDKSSFVPLFLKHGSKVDAEDQAGRTPLHLAAMSGRLACIQELIKNGAKLDARDKFHRTSLYLAAVGGSLKDLKVLCNIPTLYLSLEQAIVEGKLDLIPLFMDEIDPDSWPLQSRDGNTLFHIAAQSVKWESLARILEKSTELKFNPEAILTQDDFGRTAINDCSIDSAKVIVGYLKSSPGLLKKMIDTKDWIGNSALSNALYRDATELACLFIEEGADLRTKNDFNYNILHAALKCEPVCGIAAVVSKIKEREGGARILFSLLQENDNGGGTPIDEARRLGMTRTGELLTEVLEECSNEISEP